MVILVFRQAFWFVFRVPFLRTTIAQEFVLTGSPTLVCVVLVETTVLDELGFLEHTSRLTDALGELGETATGRIHGMLRTLGSKQFPF
jgi:hypothetical protein